MVQNDADEGWGSFKQAGNDLFRSNKYQDAIIEYSKALEICPGKEDKNTLYRNRAACFLKLDKFQEAYNDVDIVVEQYPSDVKALFRRYTSTFFTQFYCLNWNLSRMSQTKAFK